MKKDQLYGFYKGYEIRKARNVWGVYYYSYDDGNTLFAQDNKLSTLKKLIDRLEKTDERN